MINEVNAITGEKTTRAVTDKDLENMGETNADKVSALKAKLQESDFKVLPDYDQDNTAIKKERQKWREEIRELTE